MLMSGVSCCPTGRRIPDELSGVMILRAELARESAPHASVEPQSGAATLGRPSPRDWKREPDPQILQANGEGVALAL
jgi:hypothetical protein